MRLWNDEREVKLFGGQVRNTGGAIFSTGEAHASPVKQLKNALAHFALGAADIAATRKEARYSCLPPSYSFQAAYGIVSIVSHASYSVKRWNFSGLGAAAL